MKAAVTILALVAFMFGQPPEPAKRLEFEIASIKPIDTSQGAPIAAPPQNGPERFQSSTTLRNLILSTYRLRAFQLAGAPAWAGQQWFQIQAKAARTSSEDEIRQMLQVLLEDRFHLKAHRETRELPVYTLIVGKRGPKLADARDASLCNGNGCFGIGNGAVLASGGTMDRTAEVLTQLVDRPVLDRTGLAGHYDFQLHYDQSSVKPAVAGLATAPSDGASIFSAVEELGLKLEPTRAPVQMLVIDSVERPTPD